MAASPFVTACEGGGGDQGARIGSKELKQSQVPRLEVKLPPPPSFKKDHAPALYPDQTLSVYGLRKSTKDFLNKTVRVKAFLLDVYQCPKCPKGAKCKTCDAPHFFLSDRKNGKKDKALMVTDYPERDEKTRKPIKFETGVRYIVTGLFTKRSGTGFSHADGLLVFREAALVTVE
ncbi:MAG: hypothetical protein JRH20_02980 [Deltaproteobacteria bacterium]|nr:hypothetical protein [Deltaproteobacteria bacterium]